MPENEIEKILGVNGVPGIILGKHNNNIEKLPFESYFNKNICVFVSSGSMKTIGFLLTNLLEFSQYKKSIICTDLKGEIYRIPLSKLLVNLRGNKPLLLGKMNPLVRKLKDSSSSEYCPN